MAPEENKFGIDFKDEVVRGSIVTYNGDLIPTAPRPAPPPPKPINPVADSKEPEVLAVTPFQKTSREVATVTGGMGLALALGKATGPLFMTNFFTFALAGLIGYRTVWGVAPALHSPLMSVTNAISGSFHRSGLACANEGQCSTKKTYANYWQAWLASVASSSWEEDSYLTLSHKYLVLYQFCSHSLMFLAGL